MTHFQALTLLLFRHAYDPYFRNMGHASRASKDVDEMLARLKFTAQEWLDTDWKTDEVKDVCGKTLEKIGSERLRQYAEKIFQDCQDEQGIKFSVTKGAPPSQKQLAMIRSLGSKERPETSSAASAIIGKLLARKKAA